MNKLQRYLPTRDQLRNTRSLQFLAHLILEPNLWHFNRHSVSFGCLIGFICCFLPMPFQMVPCVILCFWLRCNLPLAIAIVWISNPITIPPLFYFAYRVGILMLGMPDQFTHIELTWEWFTQQLILIWQPLLLGSLACGLTFGITSFVLVRVYWRWKVIRNWRKRQERQSVLLRSMGIEESE